MEGFTGVHRSRRAEASVEARLALRLLVEGYTRNAAGKAFQAFKSLLAALAGERREELRGSVKNIDRVIAHMPTSIIREVGKLLGLERESLIALALHQYQYNGTDPEGVMSIYPSRDTATKDICNLLSNVARVLGDESLKQELDNTFRSFQM
ncbi:PaREP1 family protein [Vulcanisaeta distributa]|uniref:PaREP1 family protein n=1 Tax=Vulcanisaeta distributa TaxID=164451 RepID=UPI000A431F17|nr:PaREP1 family protein [Vulcanisaeta distributa]